MNAVSRLIGGFLIVAAAGAYAQPQPATGDEAWRAHQQQMREYHDAWQQAKTPEERQRVMSEHWRGMQTGAGMMGCPMMGGGMHGHGMPPGQMHMQGMSGDPGKELTAQELDQRIDHMESMLEYMRMHREMMKSAPQR